MSSDLNRYTEIFKKLYGNDSSTLKAQNERYSKLIHLFYDQFGESEVELFSTPGRTEIGGNHTDHNHGRVLAASVNLDSIAVVSKTNDNTVTLYSQGYDTCFQVDLSDLEMKDAENGTTTSLIRGIAARFRQLNYQIGGFNAYISSDVLQGSGLSSSASIEVLIGTILSAFYNDNKIDAKELAIIGQYAENQYFGKPCGLMDQTACAVGGVVTIDFKSPQNADVKKVDFDFTETEYRLVIVDTGGNHADLTDDYASVPAEMKSVAQLLDAEVIRDLDPAVFFENIPMLREKVGDRAILRAMHFMGDNNRVVKQVSALEANDLDSFFNLVTESGNSSFKWLQNIFTTKNVSEQGVSLALAITEDYLSDIGKGACRVHGGGFAGTIQVFLPENAIASYKEKIESIFGEGSALPLSIRPVGTIWLK